MAVTNDEAEQYMLGCILNEGSLIKEIKLQPEHFYYQANRIIFQTMKEMDAKSEPIDIRTMTLKLRGISEAIGGLSYLTQLRASIASVEPYKTFEKHILDAWKLRQAELIANKIKKDVEGAKDPSIISDYIQELSRLEEIGYETEFDLTGLLMEMQEEMETDTGELTGIDTGYDDLNSYTNGIQDEDLIIVAARPSVGKTAFVLNLAAKMADKQVVTSIFSLEMRAKLLMRRMMCIVGRIDATKMRNPKKLFTDDDWATATTTMGIINKYPLYIYDNPSCTVQDIRAKLRHLKKKYKDQKHICLIDYLTLIKGTGKDRVQEVGEITRSLKIMAREFQIPIIALAQLSRNVEARQDKRPMLSDLRDSGEIEQHADIIAFLYRDDYYNKNTDLKNIVELIIAKQRNGPIGKIELAFLKEYNAFLQLDKTHRE